MYWGFFPLLAERIARAGMTAVSFNFSGSGVGVGGAGFAERERFAHSTFSNDVKDIGTVCRSLVEGELVDGLVEVDSYGLFGYSRGGGAAVLHAAANQDVRCLVTWAAISHTNRWAPDVVRQWRSDGRRVVPGDDGGEDLFFRTDMLDDIEENKQALDVTNAAGGVKAQWLILHGEGDDFVPVSEGQELHRAANHMKTRLSVVDGANHTFGEVGHLEYAIDQTLAWFSRYLF
jgi:dienelactone hydrolase